MQICPMPEQASVHDAPNSPQIHSPILGGGGDGDGGGGGEGKFAVASASATGGSGGIKGGMGGGECWLHGHRR